MQGIDMHSASCGTVAASSQGALPQNKQMATIAAGVRLHQCHTTYLERIERICHSGMFLKLQCKALTCTAPLVAQLLLADKGQSLKTSKWQQLQQACDRTNVILHIFNGLSESPHQEYFSSSNAKH
jgi:hypothetical protein